MTTIWKSYQTDNDTHYLLTATHETFIIPSEPDPIKISPQTDHYHFISYKQLSPLWSSKWDWHDLKPSLRVLCLLNCTVWCMPSHPRSDYHIHHITKCFNLVFLERVSFSMASSIELETHIDCNDFKELNYMHVVCPGMQLRCTKSIWMERCPIGTVAWQRVVRYLDGALSSVKRWLRTRNEEGPRSGPSKLR